MKYEYIHIYNEKGTSENDRSSNERITNFKT